MVDVFSKEQEALTGLGWIVLRFWEHDLLKPEKCASQILRSLNLARKRLKSRRK
jgi:very-short-patch-repair endonuclease